MNSVIFTRLAASLSLRSLLFIQFCMSLLAPNYSMAMEDADGEICLVADSTGNMREDDVKKRSSGSLYEKLEETKDKYELKKINKAFSNIDKLFSHTVVKVQKIKDDGTLGDDTVVDLNSFLSAPHDLDQITALIEKSLRRKLTQHELELFEQEDTPSFPQAVRDLWRNNFIDHKKAHALILNASPLSSQELIRLVENGAVKTNKGYLVQLRTGNTFGDALKLFDSIEAVIRTLKANEGMDLSNIPIVELLRTPLRPELVEAFEEAGMSADDTISDARVIREMRRHFLFVSRIGMPIRFRPGTVNFNATATGAAAAVNPTNAASLLVTPNTISSTLLGNYYISSLNSSVTHTMFVNPIGLSYSGTFATDGHAADWWLYYTDGYLGGGANYTVNIDQGTFWSNGQPTFLCFGIMASGWRNNLTIGISLQTLLANAIGFGANAMMNVTRAHDVTLQAQYPMDGKIAAIRGLHKIEIDDTIGVSGTMAVAANFSASKVPVTVAFRAGAGYTLRRIYRTHADLGTAQRMLSESEIAGVLFLLGKKIKETRLPKFEHPELLIDGDELVETKTGQLSGAFVIGLESLVPISAARVGGTAEVTAEFELGLRRLPNDKFEVSIEPKRIYELGLFASMLNLLGAGYIKNIAVARKQIFIFDFEQASAKLAYFDLIHNGRLPSNEEIEIHFEERGPEYLLAEFRAQNDALRPRGIARTYLEKINIDTAKEHVGLSSPLVPGVLNVVNKIDKETRKSKERLNLRFEGFDREWARSSASSLATNGLIAVSRETFGGRRSKGQGFSGRYNQDLFVTHRRIHAIDDTSHDFAGNKWQFDSLIVHGLLEDTIITGDEENKMAEKINHLFSAFLGSFEQKNSKAPRTINIERSFSKKDLDELTQSETRERIATASQATGIDQQALSILLERLKNKHPDHQGLMVKQFIQSNPGLTGFAAIHQLLGAKPEYLLIRTESGYTAAVMSAKKFIAIHTDANGKEDGSKVNLIPLKTGKNEKVAKRFYTGTRGHLRAIDQQLRLLYDDKYLIDDESPIERIFGEKKVKELVSSGVRQDKTAFKSALVSSRKTILELLDLEKQGFTPEERKVIYKMAGYKRLRLKEQIELLLDKYENRPFTTKMSEKYLRVRLTKSMDMISKIDDRITKLEKDHVMSNMDQEYVSKLIDDLTNLRRRIVTSISIDHLDALETAAINKRLEANRHWVGRFFSKKRHRDYRIGGALIKAYSENDPIPAKNNNDEQAFEKDILKD